MMTKEQAEEAARELDLLASFGGSMDLRESILTAARHASAALRILHPMLEALRVVERVDEARRQYPANGRHAATATPGGWRAVHGAAALALALARKATTS